MIEISPETLRIDGRDCGVRRVRPRKDERCVVYNATTREIVVEHGPESQTGSGDRSVRMLVGAPEEIERAKADRRLRERDVEGEAIELDKEPDKVIAR